MSTDASAPAVDVRKFLLALLADLPLDRNYDPPRFIDAHRDIHIFFWQLKQRRDTKIFVQDLLFDTNGNYPHCEQIDEFLQEFQLSSLISRQNPAYKYNDVGIANTPYGDEFRRDLGEPLRIVYDGILKEFRSALGVRATKVTG
jgi:hypothetical protein